MKNQYMPLFWGDFLANTLNLSAQEVGAYFLLIAHAWEHGGVVPYKDARRIARVAMPHWPEVRAQLLPFFEVEHDPKGLPIWLHHVRVLNELTIAAKLKSKRSASGMAGAIKRWGKPMANAIKKNGKGNAIAMASYKVRKNYPSSFPLPHTRATDVEKPETEPEEAPQVVADKKASEVSRQELEAIYAAKRPKEG